MKVTEIKSFWERLARNARFMVNNDLREKGPKALEMLEKLETNLAVYPHRTMEQWVKFSKSPFAEECVEYLMPGSKHNAYKKLKEEYEKIIKL